MDRCRDRTLNQRTALLPLTILQAAQAASEVESHLDSQLQALDNLDEDGIERMRQRRLSQLKAAASRRQAIAVCYRSPSVLGALSLCRHPHLWRRSGWGAGTVSIERFSAKKISLQR